MALTLTIGGSNYLPQYQTGSARIRETVQNKSGVLQLTITVKSGQSAPAEGAEIVFKDGARYLFGGYISKVSPQEIGEGQLFVYEVEASDYSYIFNNKVARRAYTNHTLAYIVADLMDTYVDAAYGFDLTNVATGPTIASVTFDHINIRKCFEKLAKLTGYIWYVDYQKNLYFIAQTATAAPEDITDSSDNFEEISIDYDTSQVRNSVIVIGSDDGEQSANTVTESFTGDGETRSWELGAKPSEISSITINGVLKQFSLDVNERDTDVFIYSFEGASFQLTDSQTTPTGSDTIVVIYYPRIPIIVQRQDAASIAAFAAKDGGDGVYEYTIKDTAITSKAEAAARAEQELDQFSMALVIGEFITRTSLLSGGSIFSPGQYVVVNLPTHGISTDTAFLIQEVDITLDEDGSTPEYTYQVKFGGKIVGVREFLESLASQASEVQDVTQILTIEQVTDAVSVADAAPTHELFTPPFIYGPWPAYRVPLTIAAGQVASDLSGFPVYVDLSDMPAHFFDNVRSDGGDIRVTTDDGKTRVPVELVAIDTGAGSGELWFKGDLANASDNVFYIHYGNASMSAPAASDTYGSQNVWGSNAKYVGHFQSNAADSSPSGNTGTITGASNVAGRVGNGESFGSANTNKITVTNGAGQLFNNTDLTISFWAKRTTLNGIAYAFAHPESVGNGNRIYVKIGANSNNKPELSLGNGTALSSTAVSDTSTYHHFAALFKRSTGEVKLYLDGIVVINWTVTSGASPTTALQNCYIGNQSASASQSAAAILDDFSVYNVLLSENQILAEYANQNSPATFYTIGSYLRSRVGRYGLSEWG